MDIKGKYSQIARQFSERSYTNLGEFMNHRLELVLRWGCPLEPGDRVLEFACGDGYLGCLLAAQGIRYLGTDIAPGMVEVARRRAQDQGVQAKFLVMDMNYPTVAGQFEAIISFRTFYIYAHNPRQLLLWMRAHVRKKVIVDWNHLSPLSLQRAVQIVRDAGFTGVEVRPFLVPMTRRLPRAAQRVLYAVERVPWLGLWLTRYKFFVLIKGEVPCGIHSRA